MQKDEVDWLHVNLFACRGSFAWFSLAPPLEIKQQCKGSSPDEAPT